MVLSVFITICTTLKNDWCDSFLESGPVKVLNDSKAIEGLGSDFLSSFSS